ncbi:catenin delta-1-like isoform X2 [Pecten maximus]|uniref:catenin delta-1-like isoform X2 n=2 Tax=Pecten maximus TaxID=6579 RepID=UPI001458B220|nr:catenin delta-1-like isoform X2 [Pecten maximus]
MPSGHSDQDSYIIQQSPYRSSADQSYNANESAASILKTVKAQEAQFERLTKKLEEEREILARQHDQQYRFGSQANSMNSITSADDSYLWRSPGPQPLAESQLNDTSLGDTKMSSHLLDSCLRELEDRGAMNLGEDNMDYLQDDPYSSHGRIPYNSEPYNQSYSPGALNGGNPQYLTDSRSPHSSHLSLQSSGSNRQLRSGMKGPGMQGSMSSLPREQPNDNYMSYSAMSPGQDPPSPSRFNNYGGEADHYGDQSPRYSLASNDSLQRPQYDPYSHHDHRDMGPPGGRGSYNQPPPEDINPYNHHPISRDPYGDQPNYDDSRVGDSFYRDSPQGDRPDMSRGGPMIDPPSRSDSYRNPGDPYGDQPPLYETGAYTGAPPQMDDRYKENSFEDDRYRGPPGDNYAPESGYRESPVPGNQYLPPDDRFRDMSLDDPHGAPPPMEDRYRDPPPNDRYEGEPTFGNYDDYPYSPSKHDGLPDVPQDPFADDPFQQKAAIAAAEERYRASQGDLRYRDEDPYNRRTPSPGAGSDRYQGQYNDQPPQYRDDRVNDSRDGPAYQDDRDGPQQPYYQDDMQRSSAMNLNAPPPDDYHSDGRRTPSLDGQGGNWRNPDLQEVIDYLSHPSEAVKANAAGYLQHLCFNNEDLKSKTRGLDGIPPLVELLRSDYPEVQRNACGALKNLSYGRSKGGLDTKKAIENAGGVTALIRLLRKVHDEDIKEMITGILWNLSSCEELKSKIISEALTDIVSRIIVPYSGWEKRGLLQTNEAWTTVFRNATGIIRNLSSAAKEDEQRGYETRNRLRECSKLVNCLVYAIKVSVENHDKDSKPVENCTCSLRNLSFRIQEVSERDFYRKRNMTLKKRAKPEKESTGCLGNMGSKKSQQTKGKGKPDLNQNAEMRLPPGAAEFKALWEPELVRLYLSILKDGTNPVTMEAAAGAIQNLTACYWQPAEDTRATVRKEKSLPDLVDLLTHERDSVVCHVALALRNLAIDERNKELIGKYAMKQLVSRLPMERQIELVPDRTISAVVATLHEVTKNNQDFAQSLANEGGLRRLKFIKFAQGKYLTKTKEHTHKLLQSLWEFKSLHWEFKERGLVEADVNSPPMVGRTDDIGSPISNYSTMSRPTGSQGYDDNTISSGRVQNKDPYPNSYSPNGRMDNSYPGSNGSNVMGHSNPAMHDDGRYDYDTRSRGEDIPMTDIGPGYAPLDDHLPRNKVPVGAVPLFPGLENQRHGSQNQLHAEPQPGPNEQLYAQVDKSKKRNPSQMGGHASPNHVMLDMSSPGSPQGGADSWV